MSRSKARTFKLVYKGFSQEKALESEIQFWKFVTVSAKLKALNDMIKLDLLTGNVNPNAQRLLRTTATIRRT